MNLASEIATAYTPRGRVARRFLARNPAAFCLILLAVVSGFACDPASTTRIKNDTDSTIELELVLDRNQWHHGFEPEEYEQWLANRSDEEIRAELVKYTLGEGIKLVGVDLARLAGTYRVAPGGVMIAYEGLGAGPYLFFSRLVVTKDGRASTFDGEAEILEQFREVEVNVYEFRIADDF